MPSPHQLVLDTMVDMLREDIEELDSRNCIVSYHFDLPNEREYSHCLFLQHANSTVDGQAGGLFMDQMRIQMSLFTRTYTDDRQESTLQFTLHDDVLWRCINRLIHHYLGGTLADPLQVNSWAGPEFERDMWMVSRIGWRCMVGRPVSDMFELSNREG